MKHGLALGMALVLNATANLLMKIGMNSAGEAGGILHHGFAAAAKTVLTSVPLMVGLVCFGLNACFYMYALQSKALKISLAYPIMVGGGFALIAVVARVHPALSEKLTWGQLAGVALVFIGVLLIAAQTGSAQELPSS